MRWYLRVALCPSGVEEDTWKAQLCWAPALKKKIWKCMIICSEAEISTFNSRCLLHFSLVSKCRPHAVQASSSEGHPFRWMVGSQGEWSNLRMRRYPATFVADKSVHKNKTNVWHSWTREVLPFQVPIKKERIVINSAAVNHWTSASGHSVHRKGSLSLSFPGTTVEPSRSNAWDKNHTCLQKRHWEELCLN